MLSYYAMPLMGVQSGPLHAVFCLTYHMLARQVLLAAWLLDGELDEVRVEANLAGLVEEMKPS